MTKNQVLADFRAYWDEMCRMDNRLRTDIVAKREAWNNYTDMLCKSRSITMRQYETWANPF